MRILALEFSSTQRSVAAVCGAARLCEINETSKAGAQRPFAMIEAALTQAGLERDAVECLAVGLGPGSYTGVRAAIAIAQGWRLARGVRLRGVSSAAAIAAQALADGLRGTVHVVVDAQRGEWYLGAWELGDDGAREIEPLRILDAGAANARAAAGGIVIGPEATRCVAEARTVFPRAATLARLAAAREDCSDETQLEPVYLRETTFVKAPPPREV